MVNLREFLKNITCQSECCQSQDVRTNGQGNNINLSIDIKKDKVIVKDEEIQKNNTPSTPNQPR